MSTVSKPFAQSSQPASRVISYQGSVTTKDGATLTGEHTITATLYSDQNGKTPVWSGSYTQNIANGIFSVLLGSGEFPLPRHYDLSKPLWIGVRIDNGEEMQPYAQLTGAPYAISIPDGSVTKEKLSEDVLQVINHVRGNQDPQVPFGSGNYWDEQGNNLNAGTEFLGSLSTSTATTDVQIHVDNGGPSSSSGRVMLYNKGTAGTSPNLTGGFKNNAITTSDGSIIAGGGANGSLNTISSSDFSTISGGGDNSISASEGSVIAGGGESLPNAITNSIYSVIGGGGENTITNASSTYGFSVIGGGLTNSITDNGSLHGYSTIGGGGYNTIVGQNGTISGGGNNHAGTLSVISGGNDNIANTSGGASNTHGVIGGGYQNEVQGEYQTIGGGIVNKIYGDKSTIAGGDYNVINSGAYWCTIGGGAHNTLSQNKTQSTIGGGYYNTISSTLGIIGGGDHNTIGANADGSAITGGTNNLIDFDGNSFIGGGSNNHITNWGNSMIGGGTSNLIDGAGTATIAGGSINRILGNTAHFSTIGGGALHTIEAFQSVIPGGWENSIILGADLSVIGGGTKNKVNAVEGVILGGENNNTTLAGQVVGGYWNATRGAMPLTMAQAFTAASSGVGNPAFDAPLFALGNGASGARHNAFEVSYNGHSIVTDINGTGAGAGARPTIQGATYDDNIIYAWGDIAANGTITSDFGVFSAQMIQFPMPPPARIKYLIVLNHILNDGTGTQRVFTDGSVTATLEAPVPQNPEADEPYANCYSIACTKLFPIFRAGEWHTAFIVYISGKDITGGDCVNKENSFMFKVCGRRNANDPVNYPNP